MKDKPSFYFKLPVMFCFAFLFFQCEKQQAEPTESPEPYGPNGPSEEVIDSNMLVLKTDSCVLIPIGQLTQKGSSVDISINDNICTYDTLGDGLGGFWAIIPNSAFDNNTTSELKIKITKRNAPLQLFELKNDSTSAYLKSSELINWKFSDIRYTANQLYDLGKTTAENSMAIQEFVINYLSFDDSYSNFFGHFTASQTYLDKKGVCINFSRLFIALCRAAGIHARSVSGVVFTSGNIGEDSFHHHQWCEFLDENNKWRSLDLTFTNDIDITNINYIDFTYGAEETEIFSDYYSDFMQDLGRPFKTENECLVIYCYLPVENGAKFGFKLLQDNRPDSIIFEKKVRLLKTNNSLKVI